MVGDAFQEPLQEHEKTILSLLKDELPKMRMLDLGVGSGRTTRYFAKLTKEYIGVDYSSAMIAACRRIFADRANLTFLTLDARDMKIFGDGYFDFVLFSYNGIDYVDHNDRLRILQEIHRVIRKGGYFCFSAHNLDCKELYSFKLSAHPTILLRRLISILRMRLANSKAWKNMRDTQSRRRYAALNDGVFGYSLLTYYVTAEEQVQQLREAGFHGIRLFRMADGMEQRSGDYVSPWLYYLARTA